MGTLFETSAVQGFMHVLPRGIDHILFILSLTLMTARLRSSLVLCSIFTLAHSCTLALSTLGFVHVSSHIVEPIIALSIVVIALMNLSNTTLEAQSATKWLRGLMIFAFGLFHGLGFATGLANLGLSGSELAPTLVGFNIGVELAQVVVILCSATLLALWTLLRKETSTLLRPINSAVAAIALFWCIERAMLLWI